MPERSRVKVFRYARSIIFFAFALSACTPKSMIPSAPSATTSPTYNLSVVSGDGQVGIINGPLPYAFVARVTNKDTGAAAVNVSVDWSVTSGDGSFANKFSSSASDGLVSATLSLGPAIAASTVKATIHGTSTSVTFAANGSIGDPYADNSSIVGTSPIEADGSNYSTITITLKDSHNNATAGYTPTFSSTGSNNVIGSCSVTDSSGVSTCTLKSTTAETKIISITSPVAKVGGTPVVFSTGPVVAGNSTITGTGPVIANGSATSTITITLRDSYNVGVAGIVPTFAATNTGASNSYGTCSATNAAGVSTCTLSSNNAETKTLSITSPVSVTGGTVSFIAGDASAAHSTITGTTPIEPDGVSTSTITIVLKDANNNPIGGVVPTFSATGSTNSYGTCSSTDAGGSSTCTLSSTTSETKTLSLSTPITFTGGNVVFAPTAVSTAHTTITGTTNVTADGVATSTVTITLKDVANIPVGGVVPTFSATDTGSTNSYATCSSSNASTGVSTCTFTSTKAESKTLQLTSPVSMAGGSVLFIAGPPSFATSTITGSGSVVADGASTSTITITLLDAHNNPIGGTVPTFSATDTGSKNAYGACSNSNSTTGVSTCTMTSTKAESKTLSLLTPVAVTGGTVLFTHGSASITTSSITGSGPVPPDGVTPSTITVTLLDAFSNPVDSVTPTFTATNTGGSNSYGGCSVSNTSGISTCTLTSTNSETKTLSLTSPISMSGGTVVFSPGAASALHSSITGTGTVVADGASTSTVTITLKDSGNLAVVGVVPTFAATDGNSGNTYGTCSATDGTGVSTCTLASTYAQTKTLSIASPISLSGGTVTFIAGSPSATTSQITGTGPVTANGTSTSTVNIVVYDAYNNPISGTTPTFSATDTGSSNSYGVCSSTNASGVSTCTLSSSKAEVKTLNLDTPVSKAGGTVNFVAGSISAVASTITGSGSVAADGTSTSAITITLLDAQSNPVSGTTPTFSATNTGATNSYGSCSVSNGAGVSTCTLTSTRAETKTLSLLTPVSVTGGTVTFTQAVKATNSSITGTGPVNADGTASSTITITLKDYSNIAIVGVTPTFTATNTGAVNAYGACSATNASGIATCTLKSTQAETKTLSLATPTVFAGGNVVFSQIASSTYTTITGTGPITANGATNSTITITLKDFANAAIVGVTPTFSATNTGGGNTYGGCSASNGSGVSTCTLHSTKAEVKTLSLTSPIAMTGGTVTFQAGAASNTTSTITGTGSVIADGTSTSTITITLLDAQSNPISGTTPTFSATNTGAGNSYGACSSSNASGVSTCTMSSTHAETKTLSLVTPAAFSGGTVVFTQLAKASNSSITGTGSVAADGSSSSTITITLKDYANAAIVGITPTFSATDTGATNNYGACSATNGSGIATCTLKSSRAETKTLSLVSPISFAGGTVVFTQAASSSNSSITGTGPITANGSSTSTITITLKDYSNIAIVGVTPTFSATNTGGGNSYSACSSTDGTGVSTCTMTSTKAETKTLSITSPLSMSGGTVSFTSGAASTSTSTITGSGPVVANGSTTSTITITLLDAQSNPVVGTIPTFSATDTGSTNSYGTCSSTNGSGASTCTLTSTKAETKTLSITTPISMSGGTVTFMAGSPSTTTSSITGTSSISADGSSTSTVTITLLDIQSNPVVGTTPTFAATDTGSTNGYGACSSTDSSGVSTCTLSSLHAETKTLSISTPISLSGGSVVFTQNASPTYSTITGSGPVNANGSSTSTITITLKDYSNGAMVGVTPTFTATNTSSGNSYGSCSATNGSGVSTCTLSSTTAETKTLSLATPISFSGGTVVFNQAVSSVNSSITGTGAVAANGTSTSTITITLKDYTNVAMVGVTPTFTATDTGNTNSYGTCSATNGSGISTCTLSSTYAETKTLSLASPSTFSGGTVVFYQVALAANSSINGTGPVTADGVSTSTITIVLKDYANVAIVGVTPTFSATNTAGGNSYGACSATDGSGISTCTMTSTHAQTKTLSVTSPISFSGGTVVFN